MIHPARMIVALSLLIASSFTFAAPVDINTADAATLAAELEGIGPAKAEAIIAYRSEHGKFATVEQLAEVDGIGEKIVEDNRANISLEIPTSQ